MTRLTERQKEILAFILRYLNENDSLPTKQTIRKHFEWKATNSASEVIEVFIKKGYLLKSDTTVGYRLSDYTKEEVMKAKLRARKLENGK